MKTYLIVLVVLTFGLAACQSVPAERRNHCACNWQPASGLTQGALA